MEGDKIVYLSPNEKLKVTPNGYVVKENTLFGEREVLGTFEANLGIGDPDGMRYALRHGCRVVISPAEGFKALAYRPLE